ncbi:MAG TPA: prepilin-type N-terminal cleavage/methylation domain-containing protein [Bryobacteraceae bacterium]|nr:prepilin-type N-terminal cleavage/methylation domain-containing protein [Bryobacteraceae bacterium]
MTPRIHLVQRSRKRRSAGVTLMELMIAVLLLSLLSVAMVLTLRVALSAMNKTDSRLMANRRVASVERILNEEIAGMIPVTANCTAGGKRGATLMFFEGQAQSMRLASTYSLHQGARGVPMILEYQVIPGENNEGVRLVVNETWYTGPRGAGALCIGMGRDPNTGVFGPIFAPIQIGSNSFVLSDRLAYCQFSFRDSHSHRQPLWVDHWVAQTYPDAIRVSLAPLAPDAGRLQPVTLTVPIRLTRLPFANYQEELTLGQ